MYQIQKELGEGGEGKTFLATKGFQEYALKRVNDHEAAMREADKLSKAGNHDNVVKVFEVVDRSAIDDARHRLGDGGAFIVMGYIDGKTLREVLNEEEKLTPPRRGIAKLLPRKVGVASVGSAEWQPARERNFKQALLARCGRRPLALLVDEAHTLDLGVGGLLLNASQQVRAETPFLLVLAGMPGLAAHLGAMDASFWSRLGAGLLGIGRLDPDAARAALVEPLRANDVRIEAGALETVVEDSQCYPYFIQLWGDALWQDHLATGASELTSETVAAARPKVAAWVADYYQSRYRELRGGGLMSAAVAVAPLFLRQNAASGQNATASEQELDTALAATGAEDAADRFDTLESLHRLGYVWCPPGQGAPMAWSAGIPSLMRYVLDQAGDGLAGGA